MAVAGFEAFKAVNNRVKEVGGLDADGYDLMSRAFGVSAIAPPKGCVSGTPIRPRAAAGMMVRAATRASGIKNATRHSRAEMSIKHRDPAEAGAQRPFARKRAAGKPKMNALTA